VTRSRRLRILVALTLLVGMRVVYAAPAEIAAELRAVSCCTQHTGQPSSVPAARKCCQVATSAGAQATMSAAPRVPPAHTAFALLPTMPLPGIPVLPAWRGAPERVPRDGPPLYLGLLTIRR
jgi:hypothetical protein